MSGVARAAAGLADTVARRRGLEVRELLDVRDQAAASALLTRIWRSSAGSVPPELLKAMSFAGNYVAGAYRADRLVGAAVAFLGRESAHETLHLHSHVVGVAAEARRQGVGLALKLHQRSWALDRDFAEIRWTFDPLLLTNAVFNIDRLGAMPSAYHPDFYGTLDDPVNAGDITDRLLLRWELAAPHVLAALDRGPGDAPPASIGTDRVAPLLTVGSDNTPQLQSLGDEAEVVIAIPRDIGSIRRDDPPLGRHWRLAMRQAITQAIAHGYVFAGLHERRGYLLRQGTRRSSA